LPTARDLQLSWLYFYARQNCDNAFNLLTVKFLVPREPGPNTPTRTEPRKAMARIANRS